MIITHRPAIANSWLDDFVKFIGWQTKYKFVSESEAIKNKGVYDRKEFNEYACSLPENEEVGMIEFESLQNLKGAKCFGGEYDKLDWIKNLHWDLIVIDEAHEGVDTELTQKLLNMMKKDFVLYLSGTPFKALASQKFNADQIFNWSYEDEQQTKENWYKNSESENPYEDLPRLNMFTYQLSQMITDKVLKGIDLSEDENAEYAFDLNEFFHAYYDENEKVHKFVYENDVKKFLDCLTRNEKFPFSTKKLRDELAHTFWLFNRINSAKAMYRLLKDHAAFEHYEIVLAAGDGKPDSIENSEDETKESTDEERNHRSYDKVRAAIENHDRTITLSVGQLTTGVTIPEWTAVMMCSNIQSATAYMQAAFRAQNSYQFTKSGKLYRKKNAYVFDFAPERTLIILEEFANNLKSTTASGGGTKEEHTENVRQLLNFLPVIAEDEDGKMIELDAAKVLTVPIRIKAQEVIHRGFMSNFLFANIGNIFSAPLPVREILNKIEPEYVQGENTKSKQIAGAMDKAGDVSVDNKGNVTIDKKIVISQTGKIFGDKIYDKDKIAKESAQDVKKFADIDSDALISSSLDGINKRC